MYVGVVVHKRGLQSRVVNDEGEVVDESPFMDSVNSFGDFIVKIEKFKDEAVESIANHRVRLYDFLRMMT